MKMRTAVSKTKKHARATVKMTHAKQPARMTVDEKRIAREMHFNQKMARTDVAKALGRDLSCISRLLAQKKAPKPMGRPRVLTKTQVDALVALLEKMVDDAEAEKEVTLEMLMRRSRTKASARTVADRLHERGYRFRDLRAKPILTPDDVAERYAFAEKYKNKSKTWWSKTIHLHADNKMFKVATTAKGRKLLAKRTVRGVYRKKGKSLRPGHVKPSKGLKVNTGAKGILKTGGVGGGKVLVWHTIDGQWGGKAAAEMYTDVMAKALKKRYRGRSSFLLLEDNDPTGNLSKAGIKAKAAAKIKVFSIPRRSPDLNVLDYAIWHEVESRMRAQERKFAAAKKETRAAFEARLDRTAHNLSADFIDRAIKDLKRRCQLLHKAEGGLFEEGGRTRRPL